MSEAFDPDMYPDTVRFYAPGSSDSHGAPVLIDASGTVTGYAAYVEPLPRDATRSESGFIPTGEKRWNIFTPVAPSGVAVDWLAVNGSQQLRVKAEPTRLHGEWLQWRTECVEMT